MVTTLSALVGLALAAGPGGPVPVDDAFTGATSPEDVHTAVMKATVMLVTPFNEAMVNGTGFFVWKMGANGRKRVFLVTAAHVFQNAKSPLNVHVQARQRANGAQCGTNQWELVTRDSKQKPLWLENEEADVAVLEVSDGRFACVAISAGDLATRADVGSLRLSDEVFIVGYPLRFASSSEDDGNYGILRAGRVAGYPVLSKLNSATGIYFDALVTEGFSGAPLYRVRGSGEGGGKGTVKPRATVLGVVTIAMNAVAEDDYHDYSSLQIGFAALAAYARELIENAK